VGLDVAGGSVCGLLDLVGGLRAITASTIEPRLEEARQGDIRHSMADIGRARQRMGFEPAWSFRKGLELTVDWYRKQLSGC